MPATRPGVHRQHKQRLQSLKGQLDRELRLHVKCCPVCSKSGSDPYDRCQPWWQMAIELHRVRRNLRRYDQPETDNMDTLFEVDTP